MKYINKTSPVPPFFITDTSGLATWSQYDSAKKRNLKEFILDNEQYWLCCYCEKQITIDAKSSHVEHIEPKSNDIAALTFDYSNLIVSCEGNHFNEIGDNSKTSCGHKKDNNFDVINFLNPTLVQDISDYFIFDKDECTISASPKGAIKAEYTYKILNLNGKNDKLAESRKTAKEELIRVLSRFDVNLRKAKLKLFLQNEGSEFVTFFRYYFKDVI